MSTAGETIGVVGVEGGITGDTGLLTSSEIGHYIFPKLIQQTSLATVF